MTTARRRRPLLIAFTLVLILAAILLSLATRITPHVREAAVGALKNRFDSDVEIGSLQVSVFPRPEIIGSDLALRHHGRTDMPCAYQKRTFATAETREGAAGPRRGLDACCRYA